MPKIFSTTLDVVARHDRSCTVTLYLFTCKRGTPRSDEDTSGVSANDNTMLKSIMSEHKADIGDGTGAVTGGVSGVRRWIVSHARALLSACMGWHDADSEGPTEQVVLTDCQGSSVQVNDMGPGCVSPEVRSG
ncbi:hypothetical protein TIFTF001_009596 [Ficus carica]|uniref:Uncharacterized protein n=1 Tax=Ficus carica TaxID=3494 RepID=A0AA87ZWQ6_FICCA|nr:hypothetical protein TIFTF001_009596 [Ficus carica]